MQIYTLGSGPYSANTYIIIENGNAVVIDPSDGADSISDFVCGKNAEIKHILITHGHFDHVGAVYELSRTGALTAMSETDRKLIVFGSGNGVFNVPSNAFDVTDRVCDGDVLNLIGHGFKVIATPGHTPGSVCYILDDEYIFTGDTLFRLSIGRTDFEYGNRADLMLSLKKLLSLPHDYKILPGHGQPTTLYFERRNNPYVH